MNCPPRFGKAWKIHRACASLDPPIKERLDFYIKNVYNLSGYKIITPFILKNTVEINA